MFRILLLSMISLLVLTATAFSQQPSSSGPPVPGMALSPNAKIDAYNAAPGGFFDFSSWGRKKIGEVTPKSKLFVDDVKQVPTVNGLDTWVKIKPFEDPNDGGLESACGLNGCWAYYGNSNNTGAAPNLKPWLPNS